MVVLRHMRRAGEVVTVLAGIELIGIGALSLLREYIYLLGYSMILVGAFMLLAGSLSMIGSPFWILVALPVDIPLAVFGRTADLDLADGSNALRLWRDTSNGAIALAAVACVVYVIRLVSTRLTVHDLTR